jgi:hypothetical protein
VTAIGTGCPPGAEVSLAAAADTLATTTADDRGAFRQALDTDALPLGRHRLTASCGTVLAADVDVVLAADVGGTGPPAAAMWLGLLAAVAVAQARPWKRTRRTSVR